MTEEGQQSSIEDIRITDPELEQNLKQAAENREGYDLYRGATKEVKTIMAAKYPDAVNSDDDGEHSGFVVCGDFRFRPRANEHSAGEVKFERAAGKDWQPLEIERLSR